ncbi:MAG: stage V sporulation protein D [Bacilli bacterium]
MFFNNIHKRINIIFLFVSIFLFLIVSKVFFLQVIDYDKLSKLANKLWNRNLPIEAARGTIYDRNLKVLASNETTSSLVFIPSQIKDKQTTAKKISEILGVSYEDMLVHVSKKTSIERVHPEGRRLDYKIADKITNLNIYGVYLIRETKRKYNHDMLMGHTLGFVGIDNQGLSGLELEYNKYLTGEYGSLKYMSDAKGNVMEQKSYYEQPQDGINLTLTVDLRLQKSLERELNVVNEKYNPDHLIGIIMNPNTGEILALSSRPNFSPSNYKDYTVEEINRNLPIWMTYEPGSTFKIITLASSLEEHTIDLFKDHYYDSGSINVDGSRLKCWKAGGHGAETFLEVVQNSCNPGFVVMGQKLGKEKLFDYIDKFGFGKKTGVDLNGEGSGIIFNLDKVGPVELATTAFGQGVSVTPIQQITAVSAAINGGILLKPYIVKSLNEPTTNSVIEKHDTKIVRKVISNSTSEKVRFALENVVSLGSGRNAYIENYRVGGKTGTAQKVKDGRYLFGNYITSFIGFMPANKPEVIVYIAIDNAKGATQYGGTLAAPVARNVLLDAIDILNIKKQKEGIPKNYFYYDQKYATVPNVVGYKIKDAINLLKPFKVELTGNGETVIYQSPVGGTAIYEGERIRLMLN